MSTQYQLLTNMLRMLNRSALNSSLMSRVECLIYRLKLILLTQERNANFSLEHYCPTDTLQGLNRLLEETETLEQKGVVLQRIEAELQLLVQRIEAELPLPAEAGATK